MSSSESNLTLVNPDLTPPPCGANRHLSPPASLPAHLTTALIQYGKVLLPGPEMLVNGNCALASEPLIE